MEVFFFPAYLDVAPAVLGCIIECFTFHWPCVVVVNIWKVWSAYLLLLFNLFWILYFYAMPERRQAESARIREKYPDRIPVWTCNSIHFSSLSWWLGCSACFLVHLVTWFLLCRWLWRRLKGVTYLILTKKS